MTSQNEVTNLLLNISKIIYMINQQLLDYIKQQLTEGTKEGDIRQALSQQNWTNADVDEVFSLLRPVTSPLAQKEGKGKYLFKLFIYSLFGLTGFIGFVIAGLWIKFTTKINKKSKFVALVIGLVLSFIIPYGAELYTGIKYPETKKVKDALNQQFSNGHASVGVSLSKSWRSGEESVTIKGLAVEFKSKEFISGDEMIKMGKNACSVLATEGKTFDRVAVRNSKYPIYPFSIPFTSFYFNASGSCEKWNDPQFAQQVGRLVR